MCKDFTFSLLYNIKQGRVKVSYSRKKKMLKMYKSRRVWHFHRERGGEKEPPPYSLYNLAKTQINSSGIPTVFHVNKLRISLCKWHKKSTYDTLLSVVRSSTSNCRKRSSSLSPCRTMTNFIHLCRSS